MSTGGRLYGLGVGPGDPELLTLKALRILQAAPVIAYPAPDEGPSLARRIVAPHLATPKAEIAIRMPLVAARHPAPEVYADAAARIGAHLDRGRDVAVLCEGDPFFYGSFVYLFAELAHRYPVEVVPGVSSLTASAGALKMPLTARNDVLTVIPAPLPPERIAAHLKNTEAAVIIKLGRHFAKVRAVLRDLGLAEAARYIERIGMAEQRILGLDQVTPDNAPYFSIILVHRSEAEARLSMIGAEAEP
jgi:precorrin-2/cobalt-factor-2 C20-methyltransferase